MWLSSHIHKPEAPVTVLTPICHEIFRLFSEFASHMENRVASGRRQGLSTNTIGSFNPHLDNHDGSVSDSGLSYSITDRRMVRGRGGGGGNMHQPTDHSMSGTRA